MPDIKSTNEDNITAIDMAIKPIDCDEPCNVTINITWKNIGSKTEKFKPAIIVNGIRNELGIEINLHKDDTTLQSFNLANLMEGIYNICPDPN